jgi:hypothetical protein
MTGKKAVARAHYRIEHRQLTEPERRRMAEADAALRQLVEARTRHTAVYQSDHHAASEAAVGVAAALRTLAALQPTRRELLGLAEHWSATRA